MKKKQIIKALKNGMKFFLQKLPYVQTLHKINSNSKFPAGHFYSTVVSLENIRKKQDEIWKDNIKETIKGIDLNTAEQLDLIKEFSQFYKDLPFPIMKKDNIRFNYYNSYYSYTDAIILFSIIRYFEPKKIIEIGSGYSSAVMLDTNELFFNGNIQLTFIEPFSRDRLNILLKATDRQNSKIIQQNVQNVPLKVFKELQSGDILFVDSTHAVKTGSDVNFIMFEILPVLKKGVLIHFHDIHFPFEYPKDWVLNGFGWNETYFLKAFLMYNKDFKILFFSDYLHKYYKESFQEMPLTFKSTGSNLWIEKN